MILNFSCTVQPKESHFDYNLSIYISSKHQMQKKKEAIFGNTLMHKAAL